MQSLRDLAWYNYNTKNYFIEFHQILEQINLKDVKLSIKGKSNLIEVNQDEHEQCVRYPRTPGLHHNDTHCVIGIRMVLARVTNK